MSALSTRKFGQSIEQPHGRVLAVASIIVLWMFIIAGRLVYLQVFQHEWLQERARIQQQQQKETPPQRGIVYDRQGRELARSVDTETIYIEPKRVEDVKLAANALAPLLGEDPTRLSKRIQTAKDAKKNSLVLARKLDIDHAAKIDALNLKAVYTQKESKRIYPNGALAAHILGFVGIDNDGLGGVEKVFNEKIKGEGGKVLLENDGAQARVSYASYETPAKPGQNIVLTIDQLTQFRTEQALQAAVEKSHAKSGSVVVLDPKTGEILALANAPTFDPNAAGSASNEVRRNGALESVYEPGSTFKIVAYSAAIEQGYVKPDDLIDCQMGSITVAGRLVHDHRPFGTLTISEALAMSSNVAAIKLGIRVGDQMMADYIRRFGFGKRTGVELPGETAGLVRPVSKWLPSSIGSIAIGQEVGVTPVQMAAAFGALANDGIRITPHLIKEVRDADGSVVFRANPEQHRVVRADTAKALRGMLEGVTLNGTAKRAQLEGYTAAGKTGTAQKIDPVLKRYSATKFIGSFVGFAPVENPAVVIIVAIDEPKGAYHGGDVAAPVFREIAEQILPEMNVAPDTELKQTPAHGLVAKADINPERLQRELEERQRLEEERKASLPETTSDAAYGIGELVYASATRRGVKMPNLEGSSVRDALLVCNRLGIQLEALGDGRAFRQSPSPGTELIRGQTVRVEFGRSD